MDLGPGEEELITSVELMFVDLGPDPSVPTSFRFDDNDGPGGNDPVIVGGNLMANSMYSFNLMLTNGTTSPPEDITAEVREESNEHQVFYSASDSNISISYSDMDNEGRPLGLQGILTTGDASEGTLTVVLRHEPDKDASGVADGDISNAGGETDVEVTFPINIL